MDQENTLLITKSRCTALTGHALQKPGRELAATLREWLASPNVGPTAPVQARLPEPASKPWTTFGEMKRVFLQLREQIGEFEFRAELERFGWRSVNDIRSLEQAIECCHRLQFLADRAEEQRREGGNQS